MTKSGLVIVSVLIIISVLMCFFLVRLLIIKHNLKKITEELIKTKDEGYNRNLTVTLSDRDLENLAVEINSNLDHQKELKLKTEKSKKQLEQSISDIAHDLRTPLTVIKGNLQLLEEEELSEKGKTYLEISGRKAETLKSMVDEFFELSVLESDSEPVTLFKTDMIPFLSEAVIENESLIREKGLTPVINFPERSVFADINPSLMNRVINNLIGNAVKYAAGDFELTVLCDDEDHPVIKIGNAVEHKETIDIDHIFDRTYRADKARSDGSAGLGLYIAKLLMLKQKGEISASMEGDRLYFILTLQISK